MNNPGYKNESSRIIWRFFRASSWKWRSFDHNLIYYWLNNYISNSKRDRAWRLREQRRITWRHTSYFFFRALELCRQEPAVRRNNKRHERGVVAPHSADTGTSSRQSSYLPMKNQIYLMVFSTSTRDMEKVYIPSYWFLKWDFRVYISITKYLLIFDAGNICTQWSLNAQNWIVFNEVWNSHYKNFLLLSSGSMTFYSTPTFYIIYVSVTWRPLPSFVRICWSYHLKIYITLITVWFYPQIIYCTKTILQIIVFVNFLNSEAYL